MVGPATGPRMIISSALTEFVIDQVGVASGVDAATVRVEAARRGAAGWVDLPPDRRRPADRRQSGGVRHRRCPLRAHICRCRGGTTGRGADPPRAGGRRLRAGRPMGLPRARVRRRRVLAKCAASTRAGRGPQDAHRQIGAALAALHTVSFTSFGELDSGLRPSGETLLASLRSRARLRITDDDARIIFERALDRHERLFGPDVRRALCHDDLHHDNVVFRPGPAGWQLAAILDWDKAWAGPAESDCARVAFWDDMTGPGFWEAYPDARPRTPNSGSAPRSSSCSGVWSSTTRRLGMRRTRPRSAAGSACDAGRSQAGP